MNVFKTCIALCLLAASVAVWKAYIPNGRIDPKAWTGSSSATAGASDFKAAPIPDGVSVHGIVVFTPSDCPSDAAQRAEALMRHLHEQGIPYSRTDAAHFSNVTSPAQITQIKEIMTGPVPVVFVNGRAKANPTPEEVVVEYRRSSNG